MAKLKVAINGFGRIGRNFLRSLHGHKNSPLEVVAINDIHNVENVCEIREVVHYMFSFFRMSVYTHIHLFRRLFCLYKLREI